MHLRSVLAFALLSAAGNALGQGLNVVSAVEISDAGDAIVLTVRGTKPPNFTTFSMAEPPRFVVDLSEARFQGVPEEIAVNDGTIRVLRNLSYGSDAASIARIMIAFGAEVDPPDVQVQESTLIVRVTKLAGTPAVARREEPARAEPPAAAAAAVPQPAAAEAVAAVEPPTKAAVIEETPAQPRKAGADAEPSDPVVAAPSALPAAAPVAAPIAASPAPEGAARPVVDEAAERRAEARRQREEAAAARKLEAERKKEEAAAARAEALRLKQEAAAQAKAEAERRRQEAAERKAEAKRQREEAIAAAKAEADARAQEAAERKAEARRLREDERLARAAAREAELAAAGPSAQLREVGFRQVSGGSRVYLRTSVQPRFTIQDVGENVIRIELENTRVLRRNDARFLDTSFFPSAVAMITPSTRGSTYVVDIKLKEKVPYQQKIEGDMLAIDFERPAAGAPQGEDQAPLAGTPPEHDAAAEDPAKVPAAK